MSVTWAAWRQGNERTVLAAANSTVCSLGAATSVTWAAWRQGNEWTVPAAASDGEGQALGIR